jgi:two-component system LytT family sensor kinase
VKLSPARKADVLSAVAIAIALPGYYKVKYLLEGALSYADLWQAAVLLEVVFAFFLAVLLLAVYRLGSAAIAAREHKWLKRLAPLLLLACAVAVAVLFSRFFFNVVVDWGSSNTFEFDLIVLAVLLPLIVSGVADRIFFAHRAKESEQMALVARFEILKARLSPHFLFNSLNTLVDIIEEDPHLAVKFVEEMSRIYRYIIENRDVNAVPVQSELDAIASLLYLLDTRHPGAIDFACELSTDTRHRNIVPLTLQTLVENALKHNRYSASEPLQLRIYARSDELIIENTVNTRHNSASTAMGLENLARRVEHVCQRSLQISQTEQLFTVRVPLV